MSDGELQLLIDLLTRFREGAALTVAEGDACGLVLQAAENLQGLWGEE